MLQNNFMFIFPSKETARKLFAILAFSVLCLVLACEDVPEDPDSWLTDSPETEGRFGVIVKDHIKNWSALWHMSEKGSIEFCIVNRAWHAEEEEEEMVMKLRDNLEYAVDTWIGLLRKGPPDGSFPVWKRSSIDVRFGCSGDHYDIKLVSVNGSVCSISTNGASIQINYKQNSNRVVAHEFGHLMGLNDTYYEDWYRDQPDSMMKNLKWSDDDKFAIWALWKYLKTGEISCGPGYYEEKPGKCIPKSDEDDSGGSDSISVHKCATTVCDREGKLQCSELDVLDVGYYGTHYPDLQKAFQGDAARLQKHYLNSGIREGREPNALFSPRRYLKLNPDVAAAFGTENYKGALTHWIRHGMRECRRLK